MNAALNGELGALAERLRASTVAVRLGRAGRGSGVVWSSDGTIVTNAHVAARERAEVVLSDGRSLPARVTKRDAARDLALLRVQADDLTAASVRDAAGVRTGELLVALGHPLGVPNALSVGIAHAPLGAGRFVQADLRLAPGNSGGPLADAAGRVIGINSMVAGGLALAVPSGDVRRFVGEVQAARLGVLLAPGRQRDGAPALVVVGVEHNGRAQRAGVQVGDVLPALDPARLGMLRSLDLRRGGVPLTLAIPAPQAGTRAA